MTEIDSARLWRGTRLLVLLAALAYLGFYFFGLIMGVFSALELAGFTIAAVVLVCGIVAISLRARFAKSEAELTEEEARRARSLRERRGF